jgi:adenylate cyclase class 2
MVKKTRQQQQKPQKKRQNPKTKSANGGRQPVDMEVEIKLPCDEVSCLVDAGLNLEVVAERHFEDNWVYKLPDGKLRKGQYLRVRYVGDGDGAGRRHEGKLTYKGKSRRETAAAAAGGRHKGKKVREEIETVVEQPFKVVKIFKRHGLQRSFRYQNYRTIFSVTLDDERSLLAMFDETPIGNFLELEGDSAVIEKVAQSLGYPKSAFISESYVEMQVARCASRGAPLSDMLFKEPKKKPTKKKK